MPAKKIDQQPWFQRAAEKIVRERKNMLMTLVELGVPDVTAKEADEIFRSKIFQEVLRAERHVYWNELSNDPGFGKNSVIGQMLECVYMLIQEGSYDKALDGLNKLAAIAGWKGAETNINIFKGISDKDIQEAKEAIVVKSRANRSSQEALN